jgi:hypothetical protein
MNLQISPNAKHYGIVNDGDENDHLVKRISVHSFAQMKLIQACNDGWFDVSLVAIKDTNNIDARFTKKKEILKFLTYTKGVYDDAFAPIVPQPLTAVQWFERARDTLRQRLNEEEDTELMDIFDDICNGLDVLDGKVV